MSQDFSITLLGTATMTTNKLTDRPLITLCRGQHYTVLDLMRQLIGSESTPQMVTERRQLVQNLRQRLSRHLQLMRHVFFPPLHRMAQVDQVLGRRVKQFENAMNALLPRLTTFIHASERDPQSIDFREARSIMGLLKANFEQQQRHLHVLYMRHVPKGMEQHQLQIFRNRLMATVNKNGPARDTVSAPIKIAPQSVPPAPEPSQSRQTAIHPVRVNHLNERRASLWALERDAITRPVFPGEELDPMLGAVGQ